MSALAAVTKRPSRRSLPAPPALPWRRYRRLLFLLDRFPDAGVVREVGGGVLRGVASEPLEPPLDSSAAAGFAGGFSGGFAGGFSFDFGSAPRRPTFGIRPGPPCSSLLESHEHKG